MMKAFVSWSSGKDCTYALHRFLSISAGEVVCLLNMTDAGGDKSRSHGISNAIIQRQAEQLGIPLVQKPTSRGVYEQDFKAAIAELKLQGVNTGIFGDIYLDAHREWIERVCEEMEVEPVFPLWGINTTDLMADFISDGFKTVIVSVRKGKLPSRFLGRVLNNDLIAEITSVPDADACGENGEYHSFVFDGPIFNSPVSFEKGEITEDDKHWFLELK